MLHISKNNKTMIATALAACLATATVHADDDWDSLPEDTSIARYAEGDSGTGKGALFGAILGGPPGLFIGAITGKLIGRHQGMERTLQDKEDALKKLQASLSASRQRVAMLQQQVQKKNMMVASLGNAGIHPQLNISKLLQDNFMFTVNFKTGSDRIESHLEKHVRKLAKAVRQVQGVRIRLQGFADTRGASEYNMSLSQQRINAVKAILLQEGLPSNLIVVTASGESGSLDLGHDNDSLAFDRRVVISFEKKGE